MHAHFIISPSLYSFLVYYDVNLIKDDKYLSTKDIISNYIKYSMKSLQNRPKSSLEARCCPVQQAGPLQGHLGR